MKSMKSRFDVLTSAADRRSLATFRTSAAVGIVLMLLGASALVEEGRPVTAPRGDLIAMELGQPQPIQVDVNIAAPTPASAPAPARASATRGDEDALFFPAHYSDEPSTF